LSIKTSKNHPQNSAKFSKIQYCPGSPICPKTAKAQDVFEFLKYLGYLIICLIDE
jgi:hypothetical protein